jgi:hypothetical protein
VVRREQLAELGLLNLGDKEVLPGTAEKENRLDRLSWVSRIGIDPAERPVMEAVLRQAEALAGIACGSKESEEPLRSVLPALHRTRPGLEARRSELAESGRHLSSACAVKGSYFKVANILE